MQTRKHPKKGMALIISVIMCTVLLLIATTIANISIKESQMTVRTDISTNAYNNARTGLEWALFYIKKQEAINIEPSNVTPYAFTTTYGTYEVKIGQKIAGVRSIDSWGVYDTVKRKIHYELKDDTKLSAACPAGSTSITTGALGNSFDLQFDFGVTGTSTVYINGSSFNLQIYYNSADKSFIVGYKNGASPVVWSPSASKISINGLPSLISEPLEFRAYVHYINNIAAELRVEYRNNCGNLACGLNDPNATCNPAAGTGQGGSTFVSLAGLNLPSTTFNSSSLTLGASNGTCNAEGYFVSPSFALTNVYTSPHY